MNFLSILARLFEQNIHFLRFIKLINNIYIYSLIYDCRKRTQLWQKFLLELSY